jgi:hypothetical protein
MSRRSDLRAAPPADGVAGWLLLVLALPRLLRLFYPAIWVEDDFYLESAYLVRAGMRPYLDFVHPHMPVLEFVVSLWLRIFGASCFSIEVLNETILYLVSVLTYKLAIRVGSRFAAISAAVLYGFSSLTFRYHVFERESFSALLVLPAALSALDENLTPARQRIRQTVFFVLDCSVKLTGFVSAAAVLGYLVLVRRRWLDAGLSAIGIVAGICALTAFFYWRYGSEFLFQTFVFHFMKGRDSTGQLALYPARILDIIAPLLLIGVLRVFIERRWNPATILVLAVVALNYLFFGFLSPTAWGHNYLDVLPFLAVVAGIGSETLLGSIRGAFKSQNGSRALLTTVGGSLVVIFSLLTITPLVNENWLRGSIYGFGFVPRAELAELSHALRETTGPEEVVIAPAFICFEANRRELITYPETYGVYREARAEFARQGFFAARSQLGAEDFFDLIGRTAHYWADQMQDAVANGSVDAVIADSPLQLLPIVRPPLVAVSPDFLIAHDFRPELQTEHFILWKRIRSREKGQPPRGGGGL